MSAPGYAVVVEPSEEPITLAEARDHCRVDHDGQDTYLTRLIQTARRHIEGHAGPLVTQTWDVWWPGFYAIDLPLPWGKFSAVTQFAHTSGAGTVTNWTVSGADVALDGTTVAHLDTVARPARMRLALAQDWPTLDLKTSNPVRARLTAGHGAAVAVPIEIRHAMLLLIDYWNRNRSASSDGRVGRDIQNGVFALIRRHRRIA